MLMVRPGGVTPPSPLTVSITVKKTFFTPSLREGFKKKNWDESVRLTDWVDPPPSHESVRKM